MRSLGGCLFANQAGSIAQIRPQYADRVRDRLPAGASFQCPQPCRRTADSPTQGITGNTHGIQPLACFAGWRAWNWYQDSHAQDAAAEYAGLVSSAEAGKVEQVRERYQAIQKGFSGTAYAGMAGLRAAEAYAKAGDAAAATAALQDVMKSTGEPGFRPIAAVRLAGLQLDQKQYDEALKTLDAGNTGPVEGEMAGNVADRRGDILMAQGKTAEARAAWEAALKALPRQASLRQFVQFKLDAVAH